METERRASEENLTRDSIMYTDGWTVLSLNTNVTESRMPPWIPEAMLSLVA